MKKREYPDFVIARESDKPRGALK